MASRLRLIILGAPGSGKGTISSRLVKEFRLAHLSSGDLLRSNIQNKTQIGLEAKDMMSKGLLLPDDFITRIILSELIKVSMYNPNWLLDGFPRTASQAKALEDKNIDRVINLNVPFEEITNRLKHRWVHAPSGRVYNLEFTPPKVPGKDDVTGEPLTQRPDDNPKVVLERLKIYEKQTQPIIDYYTSQNRLATFTGNTSDYLWPLVKANVYELIQSKKDAAQKKQESVAEYRAPKIVDNEPVGHTGQTFGLTDYRKGRFDNVTGKYVNENVAADLVKEDPVVVADQRVVCSSSGGPLGHPKVYINLDKDEVQDCNYSGRRFIHKKYYDPAKHGKSITYQQYLDEMAQREKSF